MFRVSGPFGARLHFVTVHFSERFRAPPCLGPALCER